MNTSGSTIRIGVVGVGNMGSGHAAYLAQKSIAGATLGAICDSRKDRADEHASRHGVPAFYAHDDMLKSGSVDAVIVATPHYDHPRITIDSLDANKHVLCEKPLAVTVGEGRRMVDAATKRADLKFGIMFNQRSNPMFQKLRAVIADGELGDISRVTWLITDWFRTWTYYASGGWRATWAGEGGGVLLNQCPHNLDLIQWITGMMPTRMTAVGFVAKRHPIEVEDEVSAILEYPNGAVGHFVTTTGEAPGTNRLEICGDRGRIVAENGKLLFRRTRKSVKEILETSPESFANVETWDTEIPYHGKPESHASVTQNWVDAIVKSTPMLSPGVEGIRGLEIGNAMLMAALTRKTVDLPVDADAYDRFIEDMKKTYGGRKTLATKEGAGATIQTTGKPL